MLLRTNAKLEKLDGLPYLSAGFLPQFRSRDPRLVGQIHTMKRIGIRTHDESTTPIGPDAALGCRTLDRVTQTKSLDILDRDLGCVARDEVEKGHVSVSD